MRKPAPILFASCLLLMASAATAEELEAWRYLQALQVLQDRVATGDARAFRAQGRLIAHVGKVYGSLADDTWSKRRNAEALLVYVLSGGDPGPARALLRRKVGLALPKGALEGAVAYVEGRNGDAWRWLEKVDERRMSLVAEAQLSLVKAGLRAAADPRRALALLRRVRLLKPGTLMEEAALRRGLFLAGTDGDVDAVVRLASAYIRRFRKSWYATDFLRRLSWLLVRLDYGGKKRPIARLAPLIARLARRKQALLYAVVTREAVVAGKLALAKLAGRTALELGMKAPRYRARLRTWLAAADVVSADPSAALARLRKVPSELLDDRDRNLRLAAMVVGEAISAETAVEPGRAGAAGGAGNGNVAGVLIRAEAAIAGTEKLLEENEK